MLHHEKERSIRHSLLIDLLLIVPDIAAAVMANSVILYADVLKCSSELLATFFAWLTIRRIASGRTAHYDYGLGKLENINSICVAGFMFVSLSIVLLLGFNRILHPEHVHAEGAGLGALLMLAGVCVNTFLWMKNRRIARKERSPIMESQWRLFRAKAFADGIVLVALVTSLAAGNYDWAAYIDPLSSFVIAGFIMYSIFAVGRESLHDLLDKTLEESLQLRIIQELATCFDAYKAFHGVRSRRSGKDIYIEIFLEFHPDKKMGEVQDVIDRMCTKLEGSIPGSRVLVAPTREACSNPD